MAIKDQGRKVTYGDKSLEFERESRSGLARCNEYFTHFNKGSVIPPGITLTNEGTAVSAVTYGLGLGGTAVLTTDDVLAKSGQLTTYALWEADSLASGQSLVFEARVKFGTLATREFFVGFTDAGAEGVDTDPIALSTTSTFTTSVPTNAALVGYSDTPTSGVAFTSGGNNHTAISINTDVNTVVATGAGAVVTATYYTYRVEIDSNGDAAYFVNGAFLGAMGAAVAVNVPLAGILLATPRATAGSSEAVLTADYMYVGGKS